MELIEKQAAIESLNRIPRIKGIGMELLIAVPDVEEMIAGLPTVDAAPVKHGKWTTKRTQKHDGEWYCTVCDYEPIVMSDDMKYCPGCGAKMDLGE